MDLLMSLWLPVVLSAAAVWMWSFLSWAAMDLHGRDWLRAPDEDALMSAIRQLSIKPGAYMFPKATHAQAKDPAVQEKFRVGPMGTLVVFGPVSMPANMLATLAINLLASVLIAYAGSAALPPGASFGQVLQVLGTVGVLTYAFAPLPEKIWFQGRTHSKIMCVVDGLVQGLATGAIFAALWPK
jgi:hypothetical protein